MCGDFYWCYEARRFEFGSVIRRGCEVDGRTGVGCLSALLFVEGGCGLALCCVRCLRGGWFQQGGRSRIWREEGCEVNEWFFLVVTMIS